MRASCVRFYLAYVPKSSPVPFPAVLSHPTTPLGTAAFRRTQRAAELSEKEDSEKGFFFLPKLQYPYHPGGVPPFISAKQLDYQHSIVHKDAVDTLNRLTIGSDLEGHSLEAVLRNTAFDATRSAVHMAAAEHFNYCFFYNSIRPWGTTMDASISNAVLEQLGGRENAEAQDKRRQFERRFRNAALSLQSKAGWVYLVASRSSMDIVPFNHGTCPVSIDVIPLLGINVHESAYAMDYKTAEGSRGLEAYVSNFLKAANWSLASQYYAAFLAGNSEL